mgnify:CR=1 FL=1
MVQFFGKGEIVKGSDVEITVALFSPCAVIPVEDITEFVCNFYTDGSGSITKQLIDFTVAGANGTVHLNKEELEVLGDGNIRYVLEYTYVDEEGETHVTKDISSSYYLKTPKPYTPIHIVTEDNTQYFDKLVKRADYLYDAEYSQLDYEYAKDYFKTKAPELVQGGCTSVRNGNFYGRNLDWLYSNYVDVIVHTKDTLGVSGAISTLTKDYVESDQKGTIYKLVPFYLQDGINTHGVFANVNVVNKEESKGTTTYSIPAIEKRDEICSIMLVRYILDNFNTATEAVEYIRDYVSIYMPGALTDMGYESHWMIGDSQKTYVLEIVNNHIVYKEQNILSNFYIDGTTANTDGTYYSIIDNPAHNPITENGLTPYASGVERYNIAALHEGTMRELMNKLMYTQTYTKNEGNDFWYSEYVGAGLGIDNTVADYEENGRIGRIKQQFAERTRENPVTWQTTHSCVYDISGLTLEIIAQEDPEQIFEAILERQFQGAQGARGEQGIQGSQGARGLDGAQGSQGARGLDGAQGPQGARGLDGAQGPQGAQGDKGEQGIQGAQGDKGDTIEYTAGSGISIDNNVISCTVTGSTGGLKIYHLDRMTSGECKSLYDELVIESRKEYPEYGNYRILRVCNGDGGSYYFSTEMEFYITGMEKNNAFYFTNVIGNNRYDRLILQRFTLESNGIITSVNANTINPVYTAGTGIKINENHVISLDN